MDIIQSETGQPLREELARSPNKIIQCAFPAPTASDDPAGAMVLQAVPAGGPENAYMGLNTGGSAAMQTSEVQFQGIALVSALVKLSPDWLFQNRSVFDALVSLWQSPARQERLRNEQGLSLSQVGNSHHLQCILSPLSLCLFIFSLCAETVHDLCRDLYARLPFSESSAQWYWYGQVKESKRLVKCFLNYLRHDKTEVNVLFEMLSIFLVRTRVDYTFLKEFFMVEVGLCNPSLDMPELVAWHRM
jgi:transformation/transcription domain-associated protein